MCESLEIDEMYGDLDEVSCFLFFARGISRITGFPVVVGFGCQ